ncbi:MAG TPA: hypothetical protein PLM07_01145 [Candidatus Rifleibacterium sp.]|nr:hypothetical protein [Candidatus Rifleibacterium sp.]HPT44487.1 hypothetical protein [Candidatus Rifleibacterium sp.]
MSLKRPLCLASLMLIGLTASVSAIEVEPGRESRYFPKSKIRFFDSKLEEGGVLADGMNVERVSGHTDKPEAQIAVWMPLYEPAPLEKNGANMITDAALIYRNTGAGKDKFPFIVKEKATGKFFVYKNVKYHWFFEQPDEKKKVLAEGNKNGVSGGEVWSPFMNLKDANLKFFEDMVSGSASESDVWDKKLFVNRHTTSFDSGIRGREDVAGSKFLQQVGMIMTYERAEVAAPTVSGNGYPETAMQTADPAGEIPGTANLTAAPADSAFEKYGPEKTARPVPDALKPTWNLTAEIDGKTYSEFTDYNVVYVEDYSYPEISKDFLNPQGTVYEGVVGKYLGYNGGANGMTVSYTNENPDLLPTSPAITNAFEYQFSSDELYQLQNPFYDGASDNKQVLFFYFLKSNDTYGPYIGKSVSSREQTYFEEHHPFWKSQPKEKRDKFLADRRTNSWEGKFLKPWEKGVVYYALYMDGDPVTRTNELNEAWKKKDATQLSVYNDIMADLNGKTSPAAVEARAALEELKTFITDSTEGTREATRFAPIGFEPHLGRCIVGPITLENIPTQHTEKTVQQTDPATGKAIDVKSGSWTVAGKRIIMPRHFATNSIEWNEHVVPAAPSGKDPKAMKVYYSEILKSPPDCLLTQQVSNCCGNSAPAGSMVKVEDVAEFSKPLIKAEVEDMNNGVTHKIGVPPVESLAAGSQLVSKELKTGTVTNHGEEGCKEDFDMTEKEWSIIKADGTEEKLSRIPTDPEGPDKNGIPVEDQRMRFSLAPYDNIDNLTPFRGVLKTEVEIEALDENRQPTGKLEEIEHETDGKIVTANKVVKDGSGLDKFELNDFDPKVSFYHIFRAAGWYQFRVKAYDRAKNGGIGQAREMKFNINVLPASFRTRSIDSN